MTVKLRKSLIKSAYFNPIQGGNMLILRTKNDIIKGAENIREEDIYAERIRISGAA